jgi:hypothetical protein
MEQVAISGLENTGGHGVLQAVLRPSPSTFIWGLVAHSRGLPPPGVAP